MLLLLILIGYLVNYVCIRLMMAIIKAEPKFGAIEYISIVIPYGALLAFIVICICALFMNIYDQLKKV